MDLADADLVTAVVKPYDHLKARAMARLRTAPLRVPFSVGIELLFVAHKHGISRRDFLEAACRHFDVERRDVLLAAARALDVGQVRHVFDAVHASQALLDGAKLHTTDQGLLQSGFPATAF